MYNVQRRQRSPAGRLVVLLYVVDSLIFRIPVPQNGGIARGAVQRNTILFPLKAYSLETYAKLQQAYGEDALHVSVG